MKVRTAKKAPDKETVFQSELARRLSPQRLAFGVRNIEQNDFYRRVLIVKNFPSILTTKCVLATLAQMRDTTFSMHLAPMPGGQAKRLIDNQLNNLTAKGHANNATDKIEAGVERQNIIDFFTNLKRGNNRIYLVNIFVEVYGKTLPELESSVDKVVSELSGYGITIEQLSYEQREGFLSVYPLGEDKFRASANNMPTSTLADLYPMSYSAKNDPRGLLLGQTADGGNMFVDFFLRNTFFANGNFVIIGESGQGKSYLMKKILSQLIATGVSCFEIDPNGEYNDLFRKLGGTIVNVADGRVKINPFEIRAFRSGEDYEKSELEAFNHKAAFYQHLSWLKDFIKILIPAIDDKEMSGIMILIKDMYIQHGITEKTDIATLKPEVYPTFTDLYEFINGLFLDREQGRESGSPYHMITTDMLRGLLLLLKDVYDGSLAFLFNGHTNVVNYNLINFDVSELLQGSTERTQAALFNIATYCWNRITQKTSPTFFGLDELYLTVNRENYTFANYMKEFIKQVRKYEAIIGTATQNLGDFLDKDIVHVTSPLFNNPTYKFLFYPSDLDLGKVKSLLRLTDGEADIIKTPHRGSCLFKAGPDKFYMKVGTLPYEEKLFGAAGGR